MVRGELQSSRGLPIVDGAARMCIGTDRVHGTVDSAPAVLNVLSPEMSPMCGGVSACGSAGHSSPRDNQLVDLVDSVQECNEAADVVRIEEKKKNTDSGKEPNSTGTVSKEDEKPPKKTAEDGNETQSKQLVVPGYLLWRDLKYQNMQLKSLEEKRPERHGRKQRGKKVLNEPSCIIRREPFLKTSYDKLLAPLNGAYLLIAAVLVFGGSWACCMFRKKRQHDGIPYQELEMGLPESMAATEVETAQRWDQGWDSD
ncbi:hypothetical protein V6N12_025425 [Hibiscus sabdariffa]|uniref:Uncharacterized protein n=1 Tax=Hibiscus sabdariffa TaxID=183260 RepID=A0ABR2CIF3_9ROSI